MALTMPKTIIKRGGRRASKKAPETVWEYAKRASIENLKDGLESWNKKGARSTSGKCWKKTVVNGQDCYDIFIKIGAARLPLNSAGDLKITTIESEVEPTLKAWINEIEALKKGNAKLSKVLHEKAKAAKKPKKNQSSYRFDAKKDLWVSK